MLYTFSKLFSNILFIFFLIFYTIFIAFDIFDVTPHYFLVILTPRISLPERKAHLKYCFLFFVSVESLTTEKVFGIGRRNSHLAHGQDCMECGHFYSHTKYSMRDFVCVSLCVIPWGQYNWNIWQWMSAAVMFHAATNRISDSVSQSNLS